MRNYILFTYVVGNSQFIGKQNVFKIAVFEINYYFFCIFRSRVKSFEGKKVAHNPDLAKIETTPTLRLRPTEDLMEFVLAKIDDNPPILRISNKEKFAKKLKFPSKVDELEQQFKAAMI